MMQRMKRMPNINKLFAKKMPRRQTWQEQHEILKQWQATMARKQERLHG